MKKKLKDWIFRDYTIKIDRVREVTTSGGKNRDYRDKMFLVDIESVGSRHVMFAVPIHNFGAGIKKLVKQIGENL